jgi:hypothetical protein
LRELAAERGHVVLPGVEVDARAASRGGTARAE